MDEVSAPLLGPAPSGCCKYSCTHWLNKIHVFLTFLQSFYIVAGFTTPIFRYRSSLTLGPTNGASGRCQGSPPTVYSDPPCPYQAGRGGGHPGGQPPATRDLPTIIKQEPVEEVESAPGVSNTFPMVLPIFKLGTLLESVCTVQYHIF